MMDMNVRERLLSIPDNAKDYAESLEELDPEDIPWERVAELKMIMNHDPDKYDCLLIARILTDWGDEDGLKYLENYVFNIMPNNEVMMSHRLRGYDDTGTQILHAVVGFWASLSDKGQGDLARAKIKIIVEKLIFYSNFNSFEIFPIFTLVDCGCLEYLPLLKEHLSLIIQEPKKHFWKVADVAHFLMKYDSNFVEKTLANHNKTMADFPNK